MLPVTSKEQMINVIKAMNPYRSPYWMKQDCDSIRSFIVKKNVKLSDPLYMKLAVESEIDDLVNLFLDHNADISWSQEESPMYDESNLVTLAASSETLSLSTLKRLVKLGIPVLPSILMEVGTAKFIPYLLENGADINFKFDNGLTLFQRWDCWSDEYEDNAPEIRKALVKAGADTTPLIPPEAMEFKLVVSEEEYKGGLENAYKSLDESCKELGELGRKLNNKDFVNKAPPEIVEQAKQRFGKAQQKFHAAMDIIEGSRSNSETEL